MHSKVKLSGTGGPAAGFLHTVEICCTLHHWLGFWRAVPARGGVASFLVAPNRTLIQSTRDSHPLLFNRTVDWVPLETQTVRTLLFNLYLDGLKTHWGRSPFSQQIHNKSIKVSKTRCRQNIKPNHILGEKAILLTLLKTIHTFSSSMTWTVTN